MKRHERGSRRIVDLVGAANLLDAPLVQHHDAIGEFHRLFLVVCDEHGGVAGTVVDLAQPMPEFAAHLGVERAERLIEEKHRGSIASARASATRWRWPPELTRVALLEARELHEIEQRQHAFADIGAEGQRARGRTFRPKAMLSNTLMWRKSA